jgi:uncharacterized protein YjbJ (UPF0337 family)
MSNDEATDRPAQDQAAEARAGLISSVAGKAKEVAGAVTGKDDLVQEGQLQQAEARNRKSALADEAVADAKQEEAASQLGRTVSDVAEQERESRSQAEHEETVAEQQRAGEHADADRAADHQQAAGEQTAERQAEELAETRLRESEALATDATVTEQQSAAEILRLQQEATTAEQQAAQLRAETEK